MVLIAASKTDRRGVLRERILRRLLQPESDQRRPRSLYGIAKDADVAYSWAYELMKDFEKLRAAKGCRVTRPDRLYSYWLRHHVPPLFSDYQVPDPVKLLTETDLPYAVTTYGADQAIQRFLFPRRYDVCIMEEDAPAWYNEILRNGFVGGGNLRLLLGDEDILRTGEKHRGLRIVCIPQLILDLIVEGGVCTEAARMLYKRTYHADPPVHWP